MAEYIERESAIQEVMASKWQDSADGAMAMQIVAAVPAADVAPVVHGRWLFKSRWHDSIDENICSECGQLMTTAAENQMNFCPNCGAKMDGKNGGLEWND